MNDIEIYCAARNAIRYMTKKLSTDRMGTNDQSMRYLYKLIPSTNKKIISTNEKKWNCMLLQCC